MTRPHGYARYRLDGCRCYTCGLARAEYDDRRNRLRAYGRWQPFVPIDETRQRILDLKALGLGDRAIAQLAGLGRKTIRDLSTGIRHDPSRGNPPMTKVRTETAAAIAAIPYDPLVAPGHAIVDATLTWVRIHGLIVSGYTREWIAHQLGATRPALQLSESRVIAANARAVRDLVVRVGATLGPSQHARDEGRRRGWPMLADLDLPELEKSRPRAAYTCAHSRARLGDAGVLLPAIQLLHDPDSPAAQVLAAQFVWATDLSRPQRDALGLTMQVLTCDRTEHRYRVGANETLFPWPLVRRRLIVRGLAEAVAELEHTAGTRPRHWWVSPWGVGVTYDPITTTTGGR